MISLEGTALVLKCDCHHGGHEVTMARVVGRTLTIIARRYGDTHVVSLPIDKLGALCISLVPAGEEASNPLTP